MTLEFPGQTALVTGAGRGIGREIVRQLATRNVKVIAICRTCTDLDSLKKELPNIETIALDLRDWNQTRKTLEPFSEQIDMIVNNAAYAKCTPLGEITEQECDDHYSLNVKAIINVTQCVTNGMKQKRSGSIVNVSSLAGLVGLKDHLVYGSTKAAVDLMTKIMALELGPYNIRVNSINPGVTNTEMAKVGWSDPKRRDWMLSQCPLGRFNEPDEVAKAILFLLSKQSEPINGINLPIDGGICTTKM
ncbi:hypothetical protein DERP_005231 [Dermatophagoides pteronyssinus]|uniref:L-xylulose reductase-like n=1 Tax=Dermatophagoides pteronyssinus TaxID=6956 RepID=A0ABQ8JM14_DERPT|nr:hypothetical protein DERP_005231 [Dermatophagoides pteronyssinus]